MALSFHELGDHVRAIALAEQSLRIYEEIGDPYAEEVRKQLAGWRGKADDSWQGDGESGEPGRARSRIAADAIE
jgi:hypothetical protein